MSQSLSRNSYLSKNTGDYPATVNICGVEFTKVEDLRYGTNPHQPAAYYKPVGKACPVADMKMLKNGKSGLSQTNLEDISCALNIVKFFSVPACAVMKHVNPSGAASGFNGESLKEIYIKARDCDARAAFGSAIAFNREVDEETAVEIMGTFVECVAAPSYSEAALKVFNDSERFKVNSHIRIVQCGDLSVLPKFTGDDVRGYETLKVLSDGSIVIAAPLLTGIRSVADLKLAKAESKALGVQEARIEATPTQLNDLLTSWYININVRSNGVVIVKNGQTLSVGTGEQDRVGAVEQAIEKFKAKYKGTETIQGSVMASDGFFPFYDALETAAKAGVSAFIAPSGSIKDAEVVKRANELGVALYHAPERIFSHH